jgi:hypothetical protein
MSLALWGYQLGRLKKGRARRSAQSSSHRGGAQVALQRCPILRRGGLRACKRITPQIGAQAQAGIGSDRRGRIV